MTTIYFLSAPDQDIGYSYSSTGSRLLTSIYIGNRPPTTIPIQPEVGRSPFAEQDRRPTMGNGVSSDRGNLPSYGKRDVRRAADRKQHDWSPLAEAPITKQETNSLLATANSYSRGLSECKHRSCIYPTRSNSVF